MHKIRSGNRREVMFMNVNFLCHRIGEPFLVSDKIYSGINFVISKFKYEAALSSLQRKERKLSLNLQGNELHLGIQNKLLKACFLL